MLRRNIKRMKEKYGFDTRMFPFSLGDFWQAETYTYRPKTSEEIVKQLMIATFKTRDKKKSNRSWWDFS